MIGIIALMAIIGIILVWINLPGTFLFLLLVFLFDFFLEKTFHYSLNLPENYLLWMLCIFTIAEIIEFLLNAVMVKTYGGKNSSAFISIVGAILGAIIGNTILPIIGGFIGAAIIVRPGLVEFNVGIFFVLGVVVVQTWNPINRRLLSQSEHPDTVAVWTQLIVLPLAMIPAIFFWITPTMELLFWMATIGLLEMLNQRVLARAYIQGETVIVLALHYTRLPLAAIAGYLMFGEMAEVWIWVGATVIAAAALYLAQHERRATINKAQK